MPKQVYQPSSSYAPARPYLVPHPADALTPDGRERLAHACRDDRRELILAKWRREGRVDALAGKKRAEDRLEEGGLSPQEESGGSRSASLSDVLEREQAPTVPDVAKTPPPPRRRKKHPLTETTKTRARPPPVSKRRPFGVARGWPASVWFDSRCHEFVRSTCSRAASWGQAAHPPSWLERGGVPIVREAIPT